MQDLQPPKKNKRRDRGRARDHDIDRKRDRTAKPAAFVAPCPRTPAQAQLYELLRRPNGPCIVTVLGPAGTGKTASVVSVAIERLLMNEYINVLLCRPTVTMGDEKMGALPGGLEAKLEPFMAPFFDVVDPLELKRLKAAGSVKTVSLAHLRGQTFKDSFVVVDEAQNCTQTETRTLLTRLGDRSKIVLVGDPMQSDLPGPAGLNGLAHYARNKCADRWTEHFAFADADCQRHPAVRTVLEFYAAEKAKS